jgi:uncharacterized damage-inducible protein DinB
MTELLKKQYALVQSSRTAVFDFIDIHVGAGFNSPVAAYNDQTIRYFLVHNANTYLQWLRYFALKTPFVLLNDEEFASISLIHSVYKEVDKTMEVFLETFAEKLEEPVQGVLSRNRRVSATPLQLFTHVITHEFHHKGQIMSMCRLLGHTPPDTDVIRF